MSYVRFNFNHANQVNVFSVTNKGEPLDAVLNEITEAMLKNDTFDQRAVFGEARQHYQFTLWQEEGVQHQTFYLKDFLFAHNTLDQAHDQDSFMRMIDRDPLGEAMRRTLLQFGLPDTAHAPYEETPTPCWWRRTIRNISHPAYQAFDALDHKPAPALKAA